MRRTARGGAGRAAESGAPAKMVRSVVGAEPCRTWTKGEAVGHYRVHQGLHIVIAHGELIHENAPTAKEPGVKRAGRCGDSSKSWSYANSAEFKAASNQLT